jgi:GT2 family glycosyltransferase
MLIRAAWDAVGPLDGGYFMYLEGSIGAAVRLRAGGLVRPRARIVHHAGAATRQQPSAMYAQLWRSRLRYYQRYHGPFYNRVVRGLVRVGVRNPTVRRLVT